MKDEQRTAARETANRKRTQVAELRRHVMAGRVGLDVLFRDPPPMISHLAIVDVMGLARLNPRTAAWREEVGRLAVRDGVNLLMPVGKASRVSREWAAVHSPLVSRVVASRRREFERQARVVAAAFDAAEGRVAA